MLGGIWKKLQMTLYTLPNKSFLTNIAVKSTPGLALVEVLHLGVASLAGLQPDVRRVLEVVWLNHSFDLSALLYARIDKNLQSPSFFVLMTHHYREPKLRSNKKALPGL